MVFLATGRYRVERGETTDDYGDAIDSATPVAESLLGSITEISDLTYQPADGRGTRVSTLVGQFKPGTDLREGDRLVDERTGDRFSVTAVRFSSGAVMRGDVRVELTRNESDRS